jgi:hypothetical protein
MVRLPIQLLALVLVIPTSVTLVAQSAPDSGSPATFEPVLLPPKAGMMGVGMHIDEMDAPPVKNVPFCATITSEHTQNFADGNRIHTSDSSMLCRDSQGRTRREAELLMLGPAPGKPATKLVTIVDPVAGSRYLLDQNTKTAHKMPLKMFVGNDRPGKMVSVAPPESFAALSAGPGNVVYRKKLETSDANPSTTENLGEQTIDGIQAAGTRVTTTIPSGQMGNEQPITVTSERWYSSQLKAVVMTKHNDPWAGELKTQFTNVNTTEPDPSLFTVPSDYTIVDEKMGRISLQGPPPAIQP